MHAPPRIGLIAISAIAIALGGCAAAPAAPYFTEGFDALPAQQALPGLAQKLFDAVPADAATWDRYLSSDAVYVGEDGEVSGKKELLASFRPFPPGLSGTIKVQEPRITEFGDVAVMVFNALEDETVFDQHIHVEYLVTQVWRREDGRWRLIATQSNVRARDPAPSPVSRARLHDYEGTYTLGDWKYHVETNGDALLGGTGVKHAALIAVGDNVFVEPGNPLGTLHIFLNGADGRVDRMIQRRKSADLTWKKLAEPPPGPPASPAAPIR